MKDMLAKLDEIIIEKNRKIALLNDEIQDQ